VRTRLPLSLPIKVTSAIKMKYEAENEKAISGMFYFLIACNAI